MKRTTPPQQNNRSHHISSEKLDSARHFLLAHAIVHQTKAANDVTDRAGFGRTISDARVFHSVGVELEKIVILSEQHSAFLKREGELLLVGGADQMSIGTCGNIYSAKT